MASFSVSPNGDVTLVLSAAEASGLKACACEGAEGLLNVPASARAYAYIGTTTEQEAARRAIDVLRAAAHGAIDAAQAYAARSRP